MTQNIDYTCIGRRAFLKNGSLVLTAATLGAGQLFAEEQRPSVRVGLVTDMHYADKKPAGSRHYRETLAKLEEAAEQFQRDKPTGGVHFVVLDACFRSDGKPYGRKNFQWTDPNIPANQVEWLQSDLKEAKGKSVVFVHQRLDVSNSYGVKNAAQVRKVLEDSGKVLAVFQGHSHKNDYREISGIHYCVLVAMVEGTGAESNGYSTMDIFADGTIRITGFRKQQRYEWS